MSLKFINTLSWVILTPINKINTEDMHICQPTFSLVVVGDHQHWTRASANMKIKFIIRIDIKTLRLHDLTLNSTILEVLCW